MSGNTSGNAGDKTGVSFAAKRLRVVRSRADLMRRRRVAVLVAEDDPEDMFLIRRYFSVSLAFEAELVLVASPDEARREAESRTFDLIFCDFWLGNQSSVALIQELSSLAQGCPVMLLSSADDPDLELIARRAGASGYMAKADLSAANLDQVVASLLGLGEKRELALPGAVMPSVRLTGRNVSVMGRAIRRSALNDYASLSRRSAGSGEKGPRRIVNPAVRFDVMAIICSMVAGWRQQCPAGATVTFNAPRMAVWCVADLCAVHDLLRAVETEGAETLAGGGDITLVPAVVGGRLYLRLQGAAAMGRRAAREAALASERRQILTSLAGGVGATVDLRAAEDMPDGRWQIVLSIPLQPANG